MWNLILVNKDKSLNMFILDFFKQNNKIENKDVSNKTLRGLINMVMQLMNM